MSQFWVAEKLPSSFPVLFSLVRNTLASESKTLTDLENSFLVYWIQSPACSLGPEFHPSAAVFQHWDSNNLFLPLSSFLSFNPALFFLMLYIQAYWLFGPPNQAGAQEHSEHRHRAPSKTHLLKVQKNPEDFLSTATTSWLVQQDAREVRTGLIIAELSKSCLHGKDLRKRSSPRYTKEKGLWSSDPEESHLTRLLWNLIPAAS